MKVSEIIQRLTATYKMDDNLAVFWWDRKQYDAESHVWDEVLRELEDGVSPAEEELGEVIGEMLAEAGEGED